jgi:hypothetical protein
VRLRSRHLSDRPRLRLAGRLPACSVPGASRRTRRARSSAASVVFDSPQRAPLAERSTLLPRSSAASVGRRSARTHWPRDLPLLRPRIGTINAMSAGAAGVPPGPAAPRTRHRTREGPVGVGEGERGHRDRAGPASILLRRGLAVKEGGQGGGRRGRRGVSGDADESQGARRERR